jgi:hypothetical protein
MWSLRETWKAKSRKIRLQILESSLKLLIRLIRLRWYRIQLRKNIEMSFWKVPASSSIYTIY